MADDLISVVDLSNQYGKHRASIFKVLKRLNIEPKKLPGGSNNRGQVIAYITSEESHLVVNKFLSRKVVTGLEEENSEFLSDPLLAEQGFSTCFY